MKEQIYIHAFGYLKSWEAEKTFRADDGLLLIVSTEDNTQVTVSQQRIWLSKYHASVYRCGAENIKVISGQVVFAVLSGKLVQYIGGEKIGVVIPFFASDLLIGRIHRLQVALDHGKHLDGKMRTELGFGLLLDIWASEIPRKRRPKVVSDAIAIIDNDYGHLYGVDDLASRVGVSKSHLIRQFQASMQITPGTYLEDTRIEKAKALLVSADLGIQMVANLCGFSSANYFSKVFKKKLGVSPSEYAKMGAGAISVQLPDELYL
jgi:AraC-like DNA-binding protein